MCKRGDTRPIPGFEGYFVGLDGTVLSYKPKRGWHKMSVWMDYDVPKTSLCQNGKPRNRAVASLIRRAFPGVIINTKTLEISGYYTKYLNPLGENDSTPPPVYTLPEPIKKPDPEPVPHTCVATCPVSRLVMELLTKLSQVLQTTVSDVPIKNLTE